MKVLDLQCAHLHVFEGWFASEEVFLEQHSRGFVECPICGDVTITKRLSAPHLNLTATRQESASGQHPVSMAGFQQQDLQAAWLALTHRILANTDDVGDRFAEEARRIHYGEIKEHGIRGKASRAETESLIEEGIAVMPLALPEALKGQLQ